MSQYFTVHPTHPQLRLLRQASDIIKSGGVIVYRIDSTYALACHIGDKHALERIRKIRRLDKYHHFTLVCRDLSELAVYARVDNSSYRVLKHFTPGPYTFVLRATREVPRRLVHPRKHTIGLRVPGTPIASELLAVLGEPLMSTTLILPNEKEPQTDPEIIRERIGKQVDLILDGGAGGFDTTTVVDLTEGVPNLIRQGLGEFDL